MPKGKLRIGLWMRNGLLSYDTLQRCAGTAPLLIAPVHRLYTHVMGISDAVLPASAAGKALVQASPAAGSRCIGMRCPEESIYGHFWHDIIEIRCAF